MAEVAQRKKKAWYFNSAYVLAEPSAELKELVNRIPVQLAVNQAGEIESVSEGLP